MADVEDKPKGRVVTGRVISNKGNQTITVLIERREPHPVYGKYIRRSTKVHAHDEKNQCNEGDLVTVRESRPYSKTKTWVLVSIDERASAQDAAHA
jgi:small subunit ribosomal protein S17